jgi:hypothetical protein
VTASPEDESELGRAKLTNTRRIELLERDRAQQSRMITQLVEAVQHGFTDAQLAQIRSAFREELADAGLRIDGAEHQDEAREDFRFLRRLRLAFDGASNKVGTAVLTAVIVICGVIIASGFWTWISHGRPP